MTDKIIIDGVDVRGCEFLRLRENGVSKYCLEDDHERSCKTFPDCYYKQLAHKTEDYQELEQATITLAEGLNIRQSKLENYKQALEEIKEQIDKQCLKCRNSTFDDEYCAEERCAVWEILQKCNEVLND